MKNRLIVFGLLLSVLGMFTACLKDENTVVTLYDDTGITSFSLGTMSRTLHTTSSKGEDSTYTATVTGSTYKFTIDQKQGLIYNVDSLPLGTDVSRVLTTVGAKNSGIVAVNLRTKDGLLDSIVSHSSTDSLDLSKPLELRVYSNSGIAYRRYMVTVNVHQEDGNAFTWKQMTEGGSPFGLLWNQRMLSAGDRVLLFGTDASRSYTEMYDVKANMPIADAQIEVAQRFGADAVDNLAKRGDEVLVLDGNRLWHISATGNGGWNSRSDDGRNTEGVARLAGASTKEIYALSSEGGLLVSTDDCLTWQSESLDNSADLLPTHNLNCAVFPLQTNEGMSRVMLVGTRPDKEYAVVWMKIVDENNPGAGQWMLVADGNGKTNSYCLPRLSSLTVLSYDGSAMSMGFKEDGLASIRQSLDGGITWKGSSVYKWPEEAQGQQTLAATVDDSNAIWVVLGGSGQVWRGRLNRLGWNKVTR